MTIKAQMSPQKIQELGVEAKKEFNNVILKIINKNIVVEVQKKGVKL